ncbi:MAG: transcriptional regulator, family [Burkholderiales bacterium]|jgi:transcriptional regulator with XRE-family HTH domain|nr:transcriptional regulator, family [Burkholderiales bacterium]
MYFDEIGKEIKKARKGKKLSQAELAASLGMSRATISGIENNTIHEIGIRKIMSICAALGLEILVKVKTGRPTLQQLLEEQKNA